MKKLHVHGFRGWRAGGLLSYERRKAGQRRPRAGHVVHHDLAAVKAYDGAALWFRVSVAGVVAYRPLSLPRLSQSVVHVGIVIHERMRLRPDTFVLALRILLKITLL